MHHAKEQYYFHIRRFIRVIAYNEFMKKAVQIIPSIQIAMAQMKYV